jgi:hypothetical protein
MPNPIYRPEHFKDVFNTALGQQVWDFLNEPENVLRMTTASEIGRPAIEAVAPYLEEGFGRDSIAPDRVKQCIGHMVRQILEREGFQVDVQGLRVRPGTVFSKATRYRLTAAEMLEKLKLELQAIRQKAASAGGERITVEADLGSALELWASARVAHPHLKTRLEMVLNTHARLAPALRVRAMGPANQ